VCGLTGAALTGAESAELQEVLEETNVSFVVLSQIQIERKLVF